MKSTSFIVPVYNEAKRLPHTINEMLNFIRSRPEPSEIIFVDDGSTDGTLCCLWGVMGCSNVRIITYRQNRGKGYAIKRGMIEACNDIVFFMDADLSVPLSVADEFLRAFDDDSVGIVIGSRRIEGSKVTQRQHWLRESLGRVFTALSNILVPGVSDFTCGFKAFRRETGQRLFVAALVDDWSFDTEILFLAQRAKSRTVEVPVEWHDVKGSKVHALRNGLTCLWRLVAIRVNYVLGRYRNL